MRISNLNVSSRSRLSVAATCLKVCRQLHPARRIFACIVLAAFAFVFASRANAQNCGKVITPNATLTLGLGIAEVQSTSNGGSYGATSDIQPVNSINCHYWVVDIAVPSNTWAGQYYSRGFTFFSSGNVPKTKAACEAYRGDSLIYMKTPEATGFQLIQKTSSKGVWLTGGGLVPTACYVGEPTLPRNPPTSGYVIYRVASSASLGGKSQTVRVTAQHPWI